MNECVTCLCYGCVHAKDSRVMHNLCSMHALDQVRFCIYFAMSCAMSWIRNTDVSPG